MLRAALQHPLAAGLAAAVLASAAWVALASVTGLTYHLMPISGGLVAAVAISWRSGGPGGRRELLGIGLGGLISAATAAGLAAASFPLDEWWLTAGALATGVVLGAGWRRLQPERQGDQIR